MPFWKRKKNWEDDYDEYYTRDRKTGKGKPGNFRFIPHLLLLGLAGSLFVGAAGLVSGPTMVEKLLTALALPLGIVWLGLIGMVYFCVMARQTWPAIAGFIIWLVLTIAGNEFVSIGLARSLEAPYLDLNVFELEPFETILVLGGGTNTALNGKSQLANHGDRIAVAARLYHAGRVKQIVCSGTQTFRWIPEDLHPREESCEVLIGLGVPAEAVLQMQGQNTSEEMDNLKKWIDKTKSSGRIGILTSAWHLPRAVRLAESQGLDVHPVPSNFVSTPFSPSPHMVVPGSGNLRDTSFLLKEYLARIVGR